MTTGPAHQVGSVRGVSDSVAVVWSDGYLGYTLGGNHPMHPVRLDLTMRLAGELELLDGPVRVIEPAAADDATLGTVHTEAYIDAVRRAAGEPLPGHGLGTPDDPVFEGMHESAALIAGGSVAAARQVWTGEAQHAVNVAGGLHHAMADHASGFCVYNDVAVAISWLLAHGARRIGYVDLDVHHGDGVQAAFYDDPRVLTVSVHQSPLTLFPGTGFASETGAGDALGTVMNVALPPRTGDAGWLRAFHATVPGALRAFQPEILVTQCGCDNHRDDPLADLGLTVDGERESYRLVHGLAHELCGGKWVATGGGGYGLVRTVPRAWTHLIAEAAGRRIEPSTPVPDAWAAYVRERVRLPAALDAGPARRQPPSTMGEGELSVSAPWDGQRDTPLDKAVAASRDACFPLLGLDPYDPRD